MPPVKPCKTLNAMRTLNVGLKAQPIEARMNTTVATVNSHRMVAARIKKPVNGIEMISAIR